MRKSLVLAALAIALAGCEGGGIGGGGSVTVEDPSDPEQIAAAIENLDTPEPGEYSVNIELVEFDLPGAPEEDVAQARGFFEMMSGQTRTMCLTEEDAAAGMDSFIETMNQGAEGCEFSEFSVDGDTIDAKLQCDDGSGATGTMEFAGTMTSTSQDMTMTMDMQNAADDSAMRMVIRNTTERTGDCAADAGNG